MIAFDFDNTIACYDGMFHRLAVARGWIDGDVATDKQAVRDAMRASGQEDAWTAMQGEIYGPHMMEAQPYPGAVALMHAFDRREIATAIVSHKTKHPYRGPQHNLHDAAMQWLVHHELHQRPIYFEPTKQAKIERIATIGAEAFLDDLPELLLDDSFPKHVTRYLFDPNNQCDDNAQYIRIQHWDALLDIFNKGAA